VFREGSTPITGAQHGATFSGEAVEAAAAIRDQHADWLLRVRVTQTIM